ncbi:MAG: chemotaxis protein CheA [Desulfobulbaceae bacterium]|nr:chemotaxis protein CheA [Desulfobulbaceae bacterium]
MKIEDDEMLHAFIEDALEHLVDIETDLLAIEKIGDNIDVDLVNKVFGVAHSITVAAGFMGLAVIRKLSHVTENILGLIRSRKIVPNPDIVNVLILATDKLEAMLNNVHTSNDEDITEHLVSLSAIVESSRLQAATPSSVMEPVAPKAVVVEKGPAQVPGLPNLPVPQLASASFSSIPEPIEPLAVEILTATPSVDPQTSLVAADTSLRVQVSLLDSLMTLACELVFSRNQLLQAIGLKDLCAAKAVGQRINLITSELQETIILTRMQPLSNVFTKFHRVVLDLASQLNKTIELTIIGSEVELDTTIIESINAPLTHLVCNLLDYGVEMPADRKCAGKSEKGNIILKAYHEAGQVVIQIDDDGKGIDGEALVASAINKGLISVEQAQLMSDEEKLKLIFLPGFSLAEKVADVSGRDVGMDVVKTNFDKLGGQVEIFSEIGRGTAISIKFPLTLAAIACQIITTSGQRYAIPQVNLEELLRIPSDQIKKRVEKIGNVEVVSLRGNILPLIRLSDVIGVERTYWDSKEVERKVERRVNIADRRGKQSFPLLSCGEEPGSENNVSNDNRICMERRDNVTRALNIVVVSANSMKYGLIVDRFLDSEEIIIKPLSRYLQQCKGYAGATIMGDGRIALMLDVHNLAQMARIADIDGFAAANEEALAAAKLLQTPKNTQTFLVFHSSEHERFAVYLGQVERIEKISRLKIENLGGKRVLQYGGGILALVTIDDVSKAHPLADQDELLVLVFQISSQAIGLLANGPIDVVEIDSEINRTMMKQPGIIGSLIIDGHSTLLVDIVEIAQAIFPDRFPGNAAFEGDKSLEIAPTILMGEDSGFSHNHVKNDMAESGHKGIETADEPIGSAAAPC